MEITETDEMYMRRCIQLAQKAEGHTSPNPMVGAVIVCDGKIIGEGWHHKAGEPHAEVNAINSVEDKELLHKSTIYVSLEPCAHTGRTPPCADLIVRMGIPRVVVGCSDSFAKVNGKGIEKLRAAGIDVSVGVLEDECRYLNRRFFTVQEMKRPYVILKWAQTQDEFISEIEDGKPVTTQISDDDCQLMVHKQRAEEDAILVGRTTAETDDPQLTNRLWAGKSPLRFVIDPQLRLPKTLRLFTDGQPTVVINNVLETAEGAVKYARIDPELKGAEEISAILQRVLQEGCQSVIIEGGAKTLQSFIDAELYDEAFVYEAPFDLKEGVKAPQFRGWYISAENIGKCVLKRYARANSIVAKMN